jgi:hypothetical protein
MKWYSLKTSGTIAIIFVGCICKYSLPTYSADQTKTHSVKSLIKKTRGDTIMTTGPHLPLGITKDMPLEKVELTYGFYSSKTGAGRQELTFIADGTVRLFYSCTYNDSNPKVIEVKCSCEKVISLFDFLEGMGFYGLPDEFSSNDPSYARRLMKFSMPGREKIVVVDEPGNYAIEQCIGAIKFCAGLCAPEAINQRFFPNL